MNNLSMDNISPERTTVPKSKDDLSKHLRTKCITPKKEKHHLMLQLYQERKMNGLHETR